MQLRLTTLILLEALMGGFSKIKKSFIINAILVEVVKEFEALNNFSNVLSVVTEVCEIC